MLIGHDEPVAAFDAAMRAERMHHAWLIAGPTGIGKAAFATMAAYRLLAHAAGPKIDLDRLLVPEEHPIARLLHNGSHPDFMRLTRLENEKTGVLARGISVEQVRSLQRKLFATTPSFSPWRVVIIDAIDDLERAAANALLKNLEEPPPNTLFLLISHAPGRLLPTIRSRCRLLRLSPLLDDDVRAVLTCLLPDEEGAEIEALVQIGQGSPGRAVGFAGLDIAGLDRAMREIAATGDASGRDRVSLARSLAGKASQPRYEAFLSRVAPLIADHARVRSGAALAQTLGLWERARSLAESAVRQSLDPQSVVFELAGLLATLAPSERAHG
jgi:DNA polymerase-3 subunit delta'